MHEITTVSAHRTHFAGAVLIALLKHTMLDPSEFLFSNNQPFAPADRRTAAELLAGQNVEYTKPGDSGANSLRRTFLANWKEVNEVTRQTSWKYRY